MKNKVLVTREVFEETLAYLGEHLEVETNQDDDILSAEELARRAQGKDALVVSTSDRVGPALLDRCPQLRAVCNVAVGYNNIDVPACTERGILVTNTPGVLDDSVADFAVCLTLATCRRLTEAEAYLRGGQWKKNYLRQLLGVDLHHSTVGLMGFGRIGQAIARRLKAFDANILYHTRTRAPDAVERGLDARYVGKDELLASADIVLLILPYSAETHHFIGAREIARMKPTAILVNMARGGIVDDAALIAALKAGQIRAAGLDVYENEPAVNPGFLDLTNVVLAPHVASATEPTRRGMAMTAARNCVAALAGQVPPNLLNPDYRSHVRP